MATIEKEESNCSVVQTNSRRGMCSILICLWPKFNARAIRVGRRTRAGYRIEICRRMRTKESQTMAETCVETMTRRGYKSQEIPRYRRRQGGCGKQQVPLHL